MHEHDAFQLIGGILNLAAALIRLLTGALERRRDPHQLPQPRRGGLQWRHRRRSYS